jgi:hypothetical protein
MSRLLNRSVAFAREAAHKLHVAGHGHGHAHGRAPGSRFGVRHAGKRSDERERPPAGSAPRFRR